MRRKLFNRLSNLLLILHLLHIRPSLLRCPISSLHKRCHHPNRQIRHQTIQRRRDQRIPTLQDDRSRLIYLIMLLRILPAPPYILHKNCRLPNAIARLKPGIPPLLIAHRHQRVNLI